MISWAAGGTVVVESSTDAVHPAWMPAGTNTLVEGASYYTDPGWTNEAVRFYRLRSQ